MNAAITINLYGLNDEIKKTFTRSIIPWGILKKAVKLSKDLKDGDAISDEEVDALAQFVVDVFGDQFTLDELNDGADLGEMMTVMKNIMTRAGAIVKENPTSAPPIYQKRK